MEKFVKTFIYLLTSVILAEICSIAVFINYPHLYYYRPWEYFDIITNHNSNFSSSWDGVQHAEDSRKNIFFYQESRKTRVTTDEYGFRNLKFKREPIININGDSFVYGSLLSDNETLSQVLQKKIGAPVLNTARTNYKNAFLHPNSKKIKVFLDCRKGRVILEDRDSHPNKFTPLITNKYNSKFDVLKQAHPKRYSVALNIVDFFEAIGNDLLTLVSGQHKKGYKHLLAESLIYNTDYKLIAKEIQNRHLYFKKKGIHYIFCPIPTKATVYSENKDFIGKSYLPRIYKELQGSGVDYIDIYLPFISQAKQERLYFKHDTHWNPAGVNLASDIIAKKIKKLLNLSDFSTNSDNPPKQGEP